MKQEIATTAAGVSTCDGLTHLVGQQDEASTLLRQMAVTYLKLQRGFEDILAPFGLVLSQFEALVKIGCKPGIIQQELVNVLLVTKGNVGALLDRLESIGLVERRAAANDRRANQLYLTAAGEALIIELFQKRQVFVNEVFKPLDIEQRKLLESLLKVVEPK